LANAQRRTLPKEEQEQYGTAWLMSKYFRLYEVDIDNNPNNGRELVLTLANLISFSERGTYVGASFDKDKSDAYKKEVSGRVNLAKVFENFIESVKANVAK
jgi:hypothetical protein